MSRRSERRRDMPRAPEERAFLAALRGAANASGHLSEEAYERLCAEPRFAALPAGRRLGLLIASDVIPVWEID